MTSLAIKYKQVEEDKKAFDNIILLTEDKIKYNIIKLNDIIEMHNEFLNFIKITNVYEIYNWNRLKYNYSNIKKILNKDKKLYTILADMYGNIISYYNSEQVEQYNKQLKMIGENNNIMLYTFIQLKNIHKEAHIKCKYFHKKEDIIKVDTITDDIKPIMTELYEIYMDTKLLNKQYVSLKNKKMKI